MEKGHASVSDLTFPAISVIFFNIGPFNSPISLCYLYLHFLFCYLPPFLLPSTHRVSHIELLS